MNQIMQKQRSPYTGGGFNVQQLKSPNFGNADGLNGMPFLVQLAKQVQRPIHRVGRWVYRVSTVGDRYYT